MSDEGEKTCPLCAEEMDLTDQQLKPCKCGYEICVWCWHHIMDMAEKEESEGRCPACRTPYNKEKIVGTTASCERLVSEMNVEKKPKSSRVKNKSSEGRKHLASVRVIQRNLVYIVGLPLNMADEDLLQHKECFGQYGKVLKVSISRTASGAIQHIANSTCSVYITYSKEEEAVRCIQSVHGFFLDGKFLRACFGTTKYCHAWLRNVTCSNPDCLYLHEIGSQEDSFTKDEIISAYTRVQQITGSTNSAQRRSGYMLPPPADEYCNNTSASSGKPMNKTAVNTNNTQISVRVSPPNSSSGRSAALPAGASWGTRVANNLSLDSSIQCTNGMLRKSDVSDELVARQRTETEALSPAVKESKTDGKDTLSQSSNTSAHTTTLPLDKQHIGPSVTKLPDFSTNDVNSSLVSGGFASGRDSSDDTNGKMEEMTHSHFMPTSIQETQILDGYDHIVGGTVTSQTSETTANTSDESGSRDSQSDFGLGTPRSRTPSPTAQFGLSDVEDDLLSFENQRPKDPEIALNKNKSSHDSHLSCHSNINSTRHKADASISSHLDRQVVDKICNFPNGHFERKLKAPEVNNAEYSNFFSDKDTRFPVGRFDGERSAAAFNMDQNSILSKILSIDPWHESLYSPHNLAKLLGLNDKQQSSIGVLNSRRSRTRSRSWFSFAREEVPSSQASDFGQSADEFTTNQCFSGIGNSFQLDKLDARNGFPFFNGMESEVFSGNHFHMSSNRMPVLRPQVAAPPGFAVPSQTPALGFTSHDRTNQIFDDSGNHQLGANSMLRHNNYEMPSVGNAISNGDVELIDPAILAVGKGLLPSSINNSGLDDLRTHYSSQLNAYEEAKFQSILQRSLPSHHSQRFSGVGENFSLLGDAYSIPSRFMDQTIANNMSPLSHFTLPQSMNGIITNRQWDGWNELQVGNNLGMAEIQMNERLGFNKL